MPRLIAEIEREILHMERKRINLEIEIWNLQKELLYAHQVAAISVRQQPEFENTVPFIPLASHQNESSPTRNQAQANHFSREVNPPFTQLHGYASNRPDPEQSFSSTTPITRPVSNGMTGLVQSGAIQTLHTSLEPQRGPNNSLKTSFFAPFFARPISRSLPLSASLQQDVLSSSVPFPVGNQQLQDALGSSHKQGSSSVEVQESSFDIRGIPTNLLRGRKQSFSTSDNQPAQNSLQESDGHIFGESHSAQRPIRRGERRVQSDSLFQEHLHGPKRPDPTNLSIDKQTTQQERRRAQQPIASPRIANTHVPSWSREDCSPDGGEAQQVESTKDHNESWHRKRPPSVEITQERPRRRTRMEGEDARVRTPPLNGSGNRDRNCAKIAEREPENTVTTDLLSHHLVTLGPRTNYDTAPGPLAKISRQVLRYEVAKGSDEDEGGGNISTAPNRIQHEQDQSYSLGNEEPARRAPNNGLSAGDIRDNNKPRNTSPPRDDSSSSRTASRGRREGSGTLEVLDQEIDIDAPRPMRSNSRKPKGSYSASEFKPLQPDQRHMLEIRFCAQVAMIVGSKVCVAAAPKPTDSKPIIERLKERLMTAPEEERYRTARDFHEDCNRMLKMYSDLGPCEGCPFEKNGTARVMCYRMRLTSIVNARMRELKQCLQAAEWDIPADGWDKKCRLVDKWFSKEDMQEDSHDLSR